MSQPDLPDEDFATWELYKNKPNYRWLFNKLEVAIRQGLHAGPAGSAPERDGIYIHRPVYNLYGMGIAAKKFEYSTSMRDDFLNHAVLPPGHFWCEWLDGPHLSIDYHREENFVWKTRSVWVGRHSDENRLTRFESWLRLPNDEAPHPYLVPLRVPWLGSGATQADRDMVRGFNVEMRSGKVIEIHMRFGNDPFDDLPVGTRVIPVWDDESVPDGAEFRGNLHEDMTLYSASGNLSNVRRGYVIERPAS